MPRKTPTIPSFHLRRGTKLPHLSHTLRGLGFPDFLRRIRKDSVGLCFGDISLPSWLYPLLVYAIPLNVIGDLGDELYETLKDRATICSCVVNNHERLAVVFSFLISIGVAERELCQIAKLLALENVPTTCRLVKAVLRWIEKYTNMIESSADFHQESENGYSECILYMRIRLGERRKFTASLVEQAHFITKLHYNKIYPLFYYINKSIFYY